MRRLGARGLLAVVVITSAATGARGALIAADGFETYAVGSQLGSANGGYNWSGAWRTDATYGATATVQSKSLVYSNGSVYVSGGSQAVRIANVTTNGQIQLAGRNFASQTGTVYFSFLFLADPTTTPVTADGASDGDYSQFGLDNSATGIPNPRVSVGHNSTTSVNDHSFFARVGTSAGNSTFWNQGTHFVDGQGNPTPYFVVAKVSKVSNANYNRVDMFINPSTTTEPGSPSAFYYKSTVNSGMADVSEFCVRLSFLESTDRYYVDEVAVGDSFASVVPEPATLALAGLGLGGMLLKRRR